MPEIMRAEVREVGSRTEAAPDFVWMDPRLPRPGPRQHQALGLWPQATQLHQGAQGRKDMPTEGEAVGTCVPARRVAT